MPNQKSDVIAKQEKEPCLLTIESRNGIVFDNSVSTIVEEQESENVSISKH